MYVPSSADAMNTTQNPLSLLSSTKDTIHVHWQMQEEYKRYVQGLRVRYQAIGSNVVQYSPMLGPKEFGYDIALLHENTYYNICIEAFTNVTSHYQPFGCIKATTATDSLSVALGSTFGAFLSLGIIVMFVFLAKWQHTRKLRMQLAAIQITQSRESYESIAPNDGEIEMSDVSLHVHDDAMIKLDLTLSSHSSPISGTGNGVAVMPTNHIQPYDGEITDMQNNVIKNIPSDATADGDKVAGSETEQVSMPPLLIEPAITVTNADDRPPDVRPKEYKNRDVRPKPHRVVDLSAAYQQLSQSDANYAQPQGIRPNLSCNW